MKKLFTERHGLSAPRVKEDLDEEQAKGLLTVINAKIDENLFGEAFSLECPDNASNSYGCDLDKLKAGLAAFNVIWPRGWPKKKNSWSGEWYDGDAQPAEWPSNPQLFDLIEFLYEHAGLPEEYSY